MSEEKLTYDQTIAKLNDESRMRGFVPFPKWLYHPDGRSQLVADEAAQSKLGGEWLASPQEAIDEKEKRDKVASDAFIAKVNAEAKAAAADAKSKKVA